MVSHLPVRSISALLGSKTRAGLAGTAKLRLIHSQRQDSGVEVERRCRGSHIAAEIKDRVDRDPIQLLRSTTRPTRRRRSSGHHHVALRGR
jgi:hypothetical protein